MSENTDRIRENDMHRLLKQFSSFLDIREKEWTLLFGMPENSRVNLAYGQEMCREDRSYIFHRIRSKGTVKKFSFSSLFERCF
jgi:hypothetical protein